MQTTMNKPTFDVDREGLAKLLERRGKEFAIFELWQNAADEQGVTRVDIALEPVHGRPAVNLRVEDDSPHGWKRLSDAFTLFAPSYKRDNPAQRGRFNLGEKLVIAACNNATISTPQGQIEFDAHGRHQYPRRKRDRGSVFEGELRMTREEFEQACTSVNLLIIPEGVTTTFNGRVLPCRPHVASFSANLLTEVADSDGYLRRKRLKTRVLIHDVLDGEAGRIYELGIPVAETGDRWDLNVQQKVPLTFEREGVPAAYLREIRTFTLNATAQLLSDEDAREKWVDDAMEGKAVSPDALADVLNKRHGENRVTYDPSDIEANRIATSKGYEVISGGSYSAKIWENIRRHGVAQPAGKVTPSPKPFSPDGSPLEIIAPSEFTPDLTNLVAYASALHERLLGEQVAIDLTKDRNWKFRGAYGRGLLYLNVYSIQGRGPCVEVDELLIHEFAHYHGGHLTEKFDDALASLGAKMVDLARQEPAFFTSFQEFERR